MKKLLLAILLLFQFSHVALAMTSPVLTVAERQTGIAYISRIAVINKDLLAAQSKSPADAAEVAQLQGKLKAAVALLTNYGNTVLATHQADLKIYHVDWAKGVIDRKE